MAEYRYYLIPDAMTRAFLEQFGKQTSTEFFDNIADLEKRYHQLREMPYNNERTWNERARFPYARLVVGVDRQNPDGAVAIIQVRNGVNYLCDDYRGPYADGSDAQIPQMAKKLVEVIGVDRVRPHTYTQRDGYTWVRVEKDSKSRIHAADYSSVYIANLPADYDLDRCFQEFNAPNRPLRYHMCSLSTSDIVVTTKNGKETAYYVDSIGFKDVSHLLPELHEVEAQRQKEQVQDEPER